MTYQPKSGFLHVMQARGFMQDCTDLEGLDQALTAGRVPAYIGFDAVSTAAEEAAKKRPSNNSISDLTAVRSVAQCK